MCKSAPGLVQIKRKIEQFDFYRAINFFAKKQLFVVALVTHSEQTVNTSGFIQTEITGNRAYVGYGEHTRNELRARAKRSSGGAR
jgi:hypothetical protein